MAALRVLPAHWHHLLHLAELDRQVPGRARALVVHPRSCSAVRGAIFSLPPLADLWPSCPQAFALSDGSRIVGFAQSRTRREPDQWEIVQLLVALPSPADDPVASSVERRVLTLLGGVFAAAEEARVVRLFVRLPAASEDAGIFRQVGFAKLLTQYTYVRAVQPARPPPAIPGLRSQERADSFPLWQLYRVSTPPVVQGAESRGSGHWDLPAASLRGWFPRGHGECWVVPGEDRPVAWCHLSSRHGQRPVVTMMVDPAALDLIDPLLDFVLAQVAASSGGSTVAFAVREYQTHLRIALEARGFRVAEASDLLVKRLALPVAKPAFAPALEKVAP